MSDHKHTPEPWIIGKLKRLTQAERIRIVGVTKIEAVTTEAESR